MNPNPTIVVAGAGSVGCFVGGLLLAAGHDVRFLGRTRITDQLKDHDLTLTDYTGMKVSTSVAEERLSTSAEILSEADIVLVCVKGSATSDTAEEIKRYAKPEAIIISLQNGVRNAETLRRVLPGRDVRAGMVPFNVVQLGNGKFHRGTSGDTIIEAGSHNLAELLSAPHLTVTENADMPSVLWGKLLLNLNNALNAISDLPLVEQLGDRNWRRKFADLFSEALSVMKAEGITPKPPSPVPAWVIPHLLRLPTPLFRAIAKQMLSMDPQARLSMWQDLQQGRKTEIDDFQGEIIKLGLKHAIPTPGNQAAFDQIKALENAR